MTTTATATADPEKIEALVGELADALLNQYLTIGDLHGLKRADYEAVYNLGYNQYNQGKYQEAARSFIFLTFHNHLEPRYHKALGATLQMLGQYERAIASQATALMLNAVDPEPMLRMGECLIAMGNATDAIEMLEATRQLCAETGKHQAIGTRAQALLEILSEKTVRKEKKR